MKIELSKEQKEKSLVLQGQICPHCGHEMDRTICTYSPTEVPSEGDFTFCLRCKKPARFNLDLNLSKLNSEEEQILATVLKERGLT